MKRRGRMISTRVKDISDSQPCDGCSTWLGTGAVVVEDKQGTDRKRYCSIKCAVATIHKEEAQSCR